MLSSQRSDSEDFWASFDQRQYRPSSWPSEHNGHYLIEEGPEAPREPFNLEELPIGLRPYKQQPRKNNYRNLNCSCLHSFVY